MLKLGQCRSTVKINCNMTYLAPLHDTKSTWNGNYMVILKDASDGPQYTTARMEAHNRWISDVMKQQDKQLYFIEFYSDDPEMYYGKFSDDILYQIRACAEVDFVQIDGPLYLI